MIEAVETNHPIKDGVISQYAGVYREWLPDPALREHVRCVWENDLTQSTAKSMQVVPDGCVDLVWTGQGLCVAGPDIRPIREPLPRKVAYAGIRFHPGAAFSWLGLPLNEIVNGRIPLGEFWGSETARLSDEASRAGGALEIASLLEAALLTRLARVGIADRQIAFLRRAAGDNCAPAGAGVDRIADYVGVSERTLRRRCMEAFGYGFKTLDRVLRFQRFFCLAARLTETHLAELAVRAGYADQAHLSREVQRMSGLTASEFVSQIAA